MSKPGPIEVSIRALFDAKIFDRGLSYYRSGAVSALVRRSDALSADVHGSEFEPYRVDIGLHDGGVAHAKCSCPYDYSDYCKHIAAVLIKFAREPEAVIERPTIGALLQELSRDALEGLLLKRLDEDPNLASWKRMLARPPREAFGAHCAGATRLRPRAHLSQRSDDR